MDTNTRTIPCPCGGVFAGDWARVECRSCGNAVDPVTETREMLAATEVIRLSTTGVMLAVAA